MFFSSKTVSCMGSYNLSLLLFFQTFEAFQPSTKWVLREERKTTTKEMTKKSYPPPTLLRLLILLPLQNHGLSLFLSNSICFLLSFFPPLFLYVYRGISFCFSSSWSWNKSFKLRRVVSQNHLLLSGFLLIGELQTLIIFCSSNLWLSIQNFSFGLSKIRRYGILISIHQTMADRLFLIVFCPTL